MAWTAPRTWVAGETVTAALLNAHVRDNLLETAPAKVTTKGDLAVATAANTLARLAIGTDGSVLVADSAATAGVRWSTTGKNPSGGVAYGILTGLSSTAQANNDLIYGIYNTLSVAKNTATGLVLVGARFSAPTVSGTGTVADAYSVFVDPPTVGATNNWAIYITGAGDTYLGAASSQVFLGGVTSNANQTTGLTVMSGAADEMITLKLSGLTHGMTSITETDTYGILGMTSSTRGGLVIRGISKYTGTWMGIYNYAVVATADTAKSNAAYAAHYVNGLLTSGTGVTSLGANGNIIAFADNSTVRFILDADGDSHQDVGTAWTNFDDHDDAALLNLLSAHVTRPDDPLREGFRDWLAQSREQLEAARLVTFNDDGHHFVNMSRLAMLLTGAVRQLSAQLQAQSAELSTLRDTVKLLTA